MAPDFLKTIVIKKKELLGLRRSYYENLRKNIVRSTYTRYAVFKKAISRTGQVNLIAEVKKASPSKGLIRDDFDPMMIARAYQDAGADAVSVLTEEEFFQGKPAYLKKISEASRLPTLMKDFIVDELQLFEASFAGASAVLLIAAILDNAQLKDFTAVARGLDLDCLVEVHDEAELDRVLSSGAEIVGINNRNLRTFDVSLEVSETLIPRIPKDKVIVAESGIASFLEVKRLGEIGAHAVLIGETFMREKDIVRKVKEVMGRSGFSQK